MEEMITETNETNTGNKKARKKETAVKSETSGLKISIPNESSQRLLEAYNTLKARGYNGKIEDVLSTLWDQITNEWCEARVETLTPDEYYLDATKQIPEIRQKLVDQAKKALLKVREGNC